MDRDGFRHMLQAHQLSEEVMEQQIAMAERFEVFVGTDRPAAAEDVRAFSAQLIAEGLNTFDNFVAVARYGRLVKNDEVYIAVFELLDGSEAMENLYGKLAHWVGKEKRDRITCRGISRRAPARDRPRAPHSSASYPQGAFVPRRRRRCGRRRL